MSEPCRGGKASDDCSQVMSDVWRYLDHECDAEAVARVRRHLEKCPECLRQMGIEQQVRQLLSRKCTEKAPPGLEQRLVVRLRTMSVRVERRGGSSAQ